MKKLLVALGTSTFAFTLLVGAGFAQSESEELVLEPDLVCVVIDAVTQTVDLNELSEIPESYTDGPCVEVCDDVDNDGDDEIDEGFDSDSDGIADCNDTCPDNAHDTDSGAPSNYDTPCYNLDIYCDEESEGTILCDGSCSAAPIECELDPVTVSITKYVCDGKINLYSDDWYPDSEGDLGVDPTEFGCELGVGYEFGYVEYSSEDESSIQDLCTTQGDGTCTGEMPFDGGYMGEFANSLGEGIWDTNAVIHCSDSENLEASFNIIASGEVRVQSIGANPVSLSAYPGDTIHCAVFNPKPVDVTFTKYECPVTEDTDLKENAAQAAFGKQGFDADVMIELGCSLADDYEFGYTVMNQYLSTQVVRSTLQVKDYEEEMKMINTLCTTQADGTCTAEIPETAFSVGEVSGSTFVNEEDMIGMICYSSYEYEGEGEFESMSEVRFGNPQSWFAAPSESLDCYAINPRYPSTGGGKTTTIPSTPKEVVTSEPEPENKQTELLDTGPTDELPAACVDEAYLEDRYVGLSELPEEIVLMMPDEYKSALGDALQSGIMKYIDNLLSGMTDEEKNAKILSLVCDIELKKEALGKKYKHIGFGSGGSLIEYVLQYTQDILILNYSL